MAAEPAGAVARRVAARPASPGKRYWSSLAHQRLGVGQRHDAVADVADRRDAELLRAARRTSRRRRRR